MTSFYLFQKIIFKLLILFKYYLMKGTSHNKIINQSVKDKVIKARDYKSEKDYANAIKLYSKVIFLKQEPEYLIELAQIYEIMLDFSTAINLHKRAQQLKNSQNYKIKSLALTKGYCLLESGSINNILIDTQFTQFIQKYPSFHNKIYQLASSLPDVSQKIINCLCFLQTDYRIFALEELEKCIQKYPEQIQLIIFQAFIKWSITKIPEGYKLFWAAHQINPEDPLVKQFLKMVIPKVESLYKETQYLLIDNKIQKCNLNIKKGLQIYPNNTNFLIIKAYIHRTKEQYQQALCQLELANKTLKDTSLEVQLRNQISLTYNQMGTFLFKKKKYQQAIALFNQGIAFRPTDWGMRANRGDCFRALNDYSKALEDYLMAHHIGGDRQQVNFRLGSVFNSRGVAQYNTKNAKQAAIEFSEAIKYCKNHPQFYINRGKAYLQIQKYGQAILDFQTALKFDPKNIQAITYLNQYKSDDANVPKKKIIYLSDQK